MAKKAKKKVAKKKTLNAKQKLFCELFATSEEFFGNGVQSYIEAYNLKSAQYASAGAGASRLLKNVKILAYINDIMEKIGFNDAHADKQLGFLMTQNAELGVKLGAIRHFNDLKQRIVQKIDLGLDKNTITLLGLIDGSSKGKLPDKQEEKDAG